jgi:adenosylcobinamide kinase/adenosylcobinamide-phosphate guanylyltransferase
MAELILITGGSRSGKSGHALQLGESLGTERIFLATCPRVDDEMNARIQRHIDERVEGNWQTHEEEITLSEALGRIGGDVVVIDCLTLWVSNLMYHAGESVEAVTESDVIDHCRCLIEASRNRSGTVISVSNEVGLGIVPENALARRYRDLVGRCNQTIAAAADRVILMVSGIPMQVKQELSE